MRIRRIAILIDGGFFLKRIKDWPEINREDPSSVCAALRNMSRDHVRKLTGETCDPNESRWEEHVYRLFFYDARPFEGTLHHPFMNKQVNFGKTKEAAFRRDLFDLIRKERKFALRLGSLKNEGSWSPYNRHMKALLKVWHVASSLKASLEAEHELTLEERKAVVQALKPWDELTAEDVFLPLRQKGVDMKIGLDIASMALKRHVDTIILVTGDSDFVPAAKVARREGVDLLLDPMWWSIDPDLMEHIDGILSGFERPIRKQGQ